MNPMNATQVAALVPGFTPVAPTAAAAQAAVLAVGGQMATDVLTAHTMGGINQGAAIAAAGIVQAHNVLNGQVPLPAQLVALMGGQAPQVAAPAAAATGAAQTPAGNQPVAQTPANPAPAGYLQPNGSVTTAHKPWWWAILAAIAVAGVVVLVMSIVGDHAGGTGNVANDKGIWALLAIVAAVPIGWMVWNRTPTTQRVVRPRTGGWPIFQRQQAPTPPQAPAGNPPVAQQQLPPPGAAATTP